MQKERIMAKKKLNVALIGAQFMGKAHTNAWRKVGMFFDLPVEPVMKVLCGKFESEVEVADAWGWQETSLDWKETVNRPDIDVVDICTPNFLHPIIAIEAAKAGKNVICEKPLANTLEQAEEMLAAVTAANIKHMCGFSYRFAPAVTTIRNMVKAGELGKIFHFRAAYQQDWIVDPNFPLVWRLKKEHTGSGALGDIGAHIVDLCHYLVGDVIEVTSAMETFIKERPITDSDTGIAGKSGEQRTGQTGIVDVDDAAVFLARLKDCNTLATFEATRFAPGRRNFNSIEIYGSEGSILWNQEDMNFFEYFNRNDPPHLQGFRRVQATDPAHPYVKNWWPSGHIIGYEHLFVHEMYEYLKSIESSDTPYSTFADAVKCQRVLSAVEAAAESKRWESVK
jgi:predicted dehydrogenase